MLKMMELYSSYEFVSVSDILPCIKIDFGNLMEWLL